jgi:hypothetical protein
LTCDGHSNGKSCSGSQGWHWTWLRHGFEVVGVKVGIDLVGFEVGDAVGFMVVGWEALPLMHALLVFHPCCTPTDYLREWLLKLATGL